MSVNLVDKVSVILRRVLYHAVKSYDMGPAPNFPSEGSLLRIFIAIKNQSSSAGCEPANLGYNDKQDNYQTAESDYKAR
jgi:hypothetical protein